AARTWRASPRNSRTFRRPWCCARSFARRRYLSDHSTPRKLTSGRSAACARRKRPLPIPISISTGPALPNSTRKSNGPPTPPGRTSRAGDSDDAAILIETVGPHALAAEALPLRADRARLRHLPETAGRQQVAADSRIHLADLPRLVDGRPPDLLLGVVAQPHGVLVMQVEQVRRFGETDRQGVRQDVGRVFLRNTEPAQTAETF